MATVTAVELEYQGSLTVDQELLDAVKILPYEKILISNHSNSYRFETYAIPAPRNSRIVCLNGPAAHLGKVGDRLVVMAFASVAQTEARQHRPLILVLDETNRPAGPLLET